MVSNNQDNKKSIFKNNVFKTKKLIIVIILIIISLFIFQSYGNSGMAK